MATESVTSSGIPSAFAHGEPTVFLEQASAVADLLGCVDSGQCADKTISAAGLLIWNLLDGAREVMEAKSKEQRQPLAAVKA